MKIKLLFAAAALLSPAGVFAQYLGPISAPCVVQTNQSCTPVSAANPLPVTGGGGGGGGTPTGTAGSPNAAVVTVQGITNGTPETTNLTQIGGVALTLGQKAGANSVPVAVASDSGLATVAAQATGNTSLATVAGTVATDGSVAPTTGQTLAGVNPAGNSTRIATDTRGGLQPAQLAYLDSTPVAVGTTAVQLDSDVTNGGSSVSMTTAQRGARVAVTVQATVALTSDVYLCLGAQTSTCSSTNYSYLLQSGLTKGGLFIPIGAPKTAIYAIGAAAAAGTIKVSSQVAQ